MVLILKQEMIDFGLQLLIVLGVIWNRTQLELNFIVDSLSLVLFVVFPFLPIAPLVGVYNEI